LLLGEKLLESLNIREFSANKFFSSEIFFWFGELFRLAPPIFLEVEL
jgi:hypothetical protein